MGDIGMAKVLCESCGSSFPLERVKDMQDCPVCGKPLWEDSGADIDDSDNGDVISKEDESEDGLMYFDEIATSYKECPELNGVSIYCGKCKEFNSLELDKFDKLVDKEYVILKKDVVLKCRGCGKEHKPRKILYKRKEHYAPPLPRCPVCNSAMLKKITTGSKFLAAATVGMFALPYNSKTFECKDCGYRF